MKPEFSRRIVEQYLTVKFHATPSSGSRVVPCARTDRQTDMTKLIVALAILRKRRLNYIEKGMKVFSCCVDVGLIRLILAVFQMFVKYSALLSSVSLVCFLFLYVYEFVKGTIFGESSL